jgi:hypothetical protein
VTFTTQHWKWPPCTTREDCIAAHLRRRTWRITVRPSEDGTPKPLVVATHGTGAQAPQAPKP